MFRSFQALRLIDLSVNSTDNTTGNKALLVQKLFYDLSKETVIIKMLKSFRGLFESYQTYMINIYENS